MSNDILEKMEENPIVAVVREDGDIDKAVKSSATIVFLFCGDLFNLDYLIRRVKKSGKKVFVHFDRIEGIGKDSKAVEYIITKNPDGIISGNCKIVKYAKDQGVFSVLTSAIVDSVTYNAALNAAQKVQPDLLALTPGIITDIIGEIAITVPMPVVAGGLVTSKNEIIEILKIGAIGVFTDNDSLWEA